MFVIVSVRDLMFLLLLLIMLLATGCPKEPTFVNSSSYHIRNTTTYIGGARWLSGRVSDSGARGRGFETYRRRVVSLSKTLYSPKVLVNYPGSAGSVPT